MQLFDDQVIGGLLEHGLEMPALMLKAGTTTATGRAHTRAATSSGIAFRTSMRAWYRMCDASGRIRLFRDASRSMVTFTTCAAGVFLRCRAPQRPGPRPAESSYAVK